MLIVCFVCNHCIIKVQKGGCLNEKNKNFNNNMFFNFSGFI